MPPDSLPLLAPPPERLALLFELSRLLGREADPAEALAPLLSAVESALPLAGGLAALAPAEGLPLRIVAASWEAERPLLGSRLIMGEGPLGQALEAGQALVGGGGSWVASPALVRGSAAGALAFRLSAPASALPGLSPGTALELIGELAALLAEAVLLRRRIAEAGRREFEGLQARGEGVLPGRKLVEGAGAGMEEARGAAPSPGGLIGRSAAMVALRDLIARVAPTDSTVLITGESGTGKELAARALHEGSRRAAGPFVAVSCAALPESLIESELFGHERGSFTGAEARRRGRFELASGGTLFLDEVGELGPAVQVKLLRVLQERSFERVGGGEAIRAELRVIAASNRDLEAEVAAGRFRQDLFWRLNVFPIRMPPLRERGGDVVILADHFAERFGRRLGKPILRISTPALDLLTSYHWPGNVRELENAVERAVVLSSDGVLHSYHLPPSLQSAASTGTGPASTLDAALARLERELLVEALKMNQGRGAAAARELGVSERRLGLALRRYGIDWRRFRTRM